MNRAYRLIWNCSKQAWIIAAEIVHGKAVWAGAIITSAFLALSAGQGLALPTGGMVTAGQAAITLPSASQMQITQSSTRAIINWNSFGIAANEAVNISQPSSQAALLNRVLGSDPSQIFGGLTANGQVFLVNPAGILFAPGSRVDVGGLVASTLNINDDDFMAGNYRFLKNGSAGTVVNQGQLTGGFVALLGNQVENGGLISTTRGSSVLAAADGVTLNFDAAGLIAVKVDLAAYDALVKNNGVIEADGGRVVMTASAANQLLATVVNTDGIVQARSVENKNGQIIIDGGDTGITRVAGTLDVSSVDGSGGSIIATGNHLIVDEGAMLKASGATGGGQILIGGGGQGGDPTIRHAITTVVAPTATLDASAIDTGNGGTVVAWSDVANPLSLTRAYGTFLAKGGQYGGNGGRIETSGYRLDTAGARVSAAAPNGKNGLWLLDPTDLLLDQTTLDNYAATLGGGTDVTAIAGQDIIADTTAASLSLLPSNATAVTFTLQADRNILLGSSTGSSTLSILASRSAPLNLVLNADHDANHEGAVLLGNTTIQTNGGSITIGGGTDPTTTPAYGYISDGSLANFSGYLNLPGVYLTSSTLDAQGGAITIHGQGGVETGTSNGSNYGVFLTASTTLTTTGNISISGTGGQSSGLDNVGVMVDSGSLISTQSLFNDGSSTGSIQITGIGGGQLGGAGADHGVYLASSDIKSEQGAITITGTAGLGGAVGTNASAGLFVDGSNIYADTSTVTVTTPPVVSGSITLTGTASNGPGVWINNADIESLGGGTVTAHGSSGSYLNSDWGTITNALSLTNPTLADFISYGNINSFYFMQNVPSGVVLLGSYLMADRNNTITESQPMVASDLGAVRISGSGGLINTLISTSYVSTYGGPLAISGSEANSSAYTFLSTGITNNNGVYSVRGNVSLSGVGRGDNATALYLGNDVTTGYDPNFLTSYNPDPAWISSGITATGTLHGGSNGAAMVADSTIDAENGPISITATNDTAGQLGLDAANASFTTYGSNGSITINGSGAFNLGYINYAASDPPASGPAVAISTDASMVLNNSIELTNAGYVSLNAPGGISSSGSGSDFIIAPALLFNGPVDFSQSDMQIQTIAGTATSGSVWVDQSATPLTVGTVGGINGISVGGTVFLRAQGVTLDQPVTASESNDAITVVNTGAAFTNNYGATALSAANGRWLVFSQNIDQDTRGGLVYVFKRYGCEYGNSCSSGATIPATGNGFAFFNQPQLTMAPQQATITYGDSELSLLTFAGFTKFLDDTTYDTASAAGITGTPTFSLGGYTASGAGYRPAGNYTLQLQDIGTMASSMGYALAADTTTSASVTVNPKPLALSGLTANNKVYDGTTAATLASTGTLGLPFAGDQVVYDPSGASANFSDPNVGAGKTVTVAGLVLSGADAANYAIENPTTTAAIEAQPVALPALQITALDLNSQIAPLVSSIVTSTQSSVPGGSSLVIGNATAGSVSTNGASPIVLALAGFSTPPGLLQYSQFIGILNNGVRSNDR